MWKYFNTMRLATVGALIITAIALLLVPMWREWPQRLRQGALALCVAPLLIAPILLGVALINFWNRPGFSAVYGDWPLPASVLSTNCNSGWRATA
jgi:ABC-type Fe3+ transport system permease subunit